ncbi:MAG: quinone-dependent dihydroorotate dehydrogenase [Verrucomicrobiales bacterium]|nr:quinone-dependent dihydroorotate dehydrogenase [Verrucomicrobiales bacterium]
MPDFYPIARRILFSLDAEAAHHATLAMMKTADAFGVLGQLAGLDEGPDPVASREVEVMGLTFPNRVGLAAGLDKKGEAISAFGNLGFGHVEVGTVTPMAQSGNDKPRLFRLKEHEAIINRMGFNNPGVPSMMENIGKSRRGFRGILGINIGKNKDTPNEGFIDDYLKCLEGVYQAADYITANLSSPNTKGLRDLQSESNCRELILRMQERREKLKGENDGKYVPFVIKIAPDLAEDAVKALAAVFSETRIDGVITTNTTIERAGVSGHEYAKEAGGLSGAPLTEKATEILALLRSEMDDAIPIIGSGGVMSPADARAKFDAGASLVQVYSGLIYRGATLVREIAEELE